MISYKVFPLLSGRGIFLFQLLYQNGKKSADTDSKTDVTTDKTNPDTGAEPIVVFGAIAVVSVGLITLSKKRRR